MAPLRRTLPALALLAVVAHAAPLREDLVDWSRNFADVAAAAPHPLNRRDASSSLSDSSVDALLLLQRPSSSTPPAARLDAPEANAGMEDMMKRQVGGVEALAETEPAVATAVAPLAAAASPAVAAAAAATTEAAAPLAAAVTTASPAVAATSNLVAAVSSPAAAATTSAKPTTSAAPSSTSNKPSSSASASSSASSSASATSSPSTGFTLSDVHNKLYPLWVGVTICGVLVALFIILAGIRCCFFKPHAREDLDSVLTGSNTTTASSTLRKGAKSLRKALTRRKLAGSSFARRQQEGSVLLEVGDEVFAVPPQVAEEYNEAKRMFGPRAGAPADSSKWNGKAYLAQCLVRHENQRRGGGSSTAPSRLVGAQNNMASETAGWSRSSLSSTLVGLDDEDKEKSAYYDMYGSLERSESQKPRRGLSARIAESIRSLRTQGSGEEEIEREDRLGEPTRTTDLTSFLNAKTATPASRAAPGGWSVQVRQDADESISTPKPVAKDYYGAAQSRNIATAPRSAAGPTSSTPRATASPSSRGGFALEDAPSAAARARVTEKKRRPALPVIPGTPAEGSAPTNLPAVSRKPVPSPQAVGLPASASASATTTDSQQATSTASRHQRAVSTPHVAFASQVDLHDAAEDEEAVFLRRHPTAASSVGSWSSAGSSSNSNSLRRSTGTTKRPSRHASMASSTTASYGRPYDSSAVQRSMTVQAPSASSTGAAAPAAPAASGVGRDRLKEMRLAQAQQQGRPHQQQQPQAQQGRRHVSAAVAPSQQQAEGSLSRSSTMAAGMSRHRDQKKPRHSVAAGGREVDLERGM